MHSTLLLPRQHYTQLGIQGNGIASFMEAIAEKKLESHSLMVLRHGKVAFEHWCAPYEANRPHMLFSLSKSFTAVAVGIAIDEGLISLHDRITSFFPDDMPEQPSTNLLNMTIRDLLIMGTGHEQDPSSTVAETTLNWVRAFLAAPVNYEPGTHFLYNNGASYMLSAIIQQATGQTLLDYLRPRLFEPLGIQSPTWETCPRGINTGGWGLKLTTEDVAKFGLLMLAKGMWADKRIVSEEWVMEMTSKQIHNGDDPDNDWNQGYGYQMWKCRHHAVRGDGMYGQFCILLPKLDAVIVMTSATPQMNLVLNEVWEHLLPAIGQARAGQAKGIEADYGSEKKAEERLARAIASASYSPLQPSADAAGAANIAEWNGIGFEPEGVAEIAIRVTFGVEREVLRLKVENTSGGYTLICGAGQWLPSMSTVMGREEPVVSCYAEQDKNTLLLFVRFIETPFTQRITFRLLDNKVEMDSDWMVGEHIEGEWRITAVRMGSTV